MICSHPLCTGKHRTADAQAGVMCPAALSRLRANQLRRYHDRYKEKARDKRRRYYLANREHLLARANAYWRAHRAQMIRKAIERQRKRRLAVAVVKLSLVKREKPTTWTDRNWWRLTPEETPRRWILEAAA